MAETKPKLEVDLQEVEKLAGQGLTNAQIASALGISARTFYNRCKDDEAFNEAYRRGRARAVSHVASKLMEAIDGGNVTAMIFWLKTQAGWKETDRHEITGEDGGALKVESTREYDLSRLTLEELNQLEALLYGDDSTEQSEVAEYSGDIRQLTNKQLLEIMREGCTAQREGGQPTELNSPSG